jgi:hypothetical protein
VVTRLVATVSAIAFASVLVYASGHVVDGQMGCDPQYNQSVSYFAACDPSTDCSNKVLNVIISAFLSQEGSVDANLEVDWDDGSFGSVNQHNSDNFFSRSFSHTYAENGTYHPKYYFESQGGMTCSHNDTVSFP